MLEEDCMLIKCIHFVVCLCFTLVTGRLSLGVERRRENRAVSVDGIFEARQRCYIQPLTLDLEGEPDESKDAWESILSLSLSLTLTQTYCNACVSKINILYQNDNFQLNIW
ncbi:hypothetical protein PO909_007748 [Leuciscus waleckii]